MERHPPKSADAFASGRGVAADASKPAQFRRKEGGYGARRPTRIAIRSGARWPARPEEELSRGEPRSGDGGWRPARRCGSELRRVGNSGRPVTKRWARRLRVARGNYDRDRVKVSFGPDVMLQYAAGAVMGSLLCGIVRSAGKSRGADLREKPGLCAYGTIRECGKRTLADKQNSDDRSNRRAPHFCLFERIPHRRRSFP